MIKYLLILFLFACSPERDTQVTARLWTLVEKKPAERFPEYRDYIWLIWESNGERYWEKVSEKDAETYDIGTIIYNRDRR